MTLQDHIEDAAALRQAARRRGDRLEAARLTKLIDDLYDQRRKIRVEAMYGPHDSILRRARIEVELERIASAR